MCLVRPSCDLPLCSYLDIFVNGPRRLPGRIFVKEFGLDLAVSGKVSCGLLAFVLVLCVRTCRPWIFLGRSRRKIFVVWIADDDTGERFASSASPTALRAKELHRRLRCRDRPDGRSRTICDGLSWPRSLPLPLSLSLLSLPPFPLLLLRCGSVLLSE